ncbi:DUF1634 domain-containing protein [Paraburkholderia fungorum]|uniref:DUF1634 domain-containing protein n=1 Tax=Paraburkholderia fungorum TaxID=134537 RepID=UPI0038B9F004
MNRIVSTVGRLEHWLAKLLHCGTWVATGIIATGLAISLLSNRESPLESALPGMPVVTAGIALFILLPVMRLILMLGMFLHQRDYRFGAITAFVLLIVTAGLLAGAA